MRRKEKLHLKNEEFSLKQEEYLKDQNTLSSQLIRDYEELTQDEEIKFIPAEMTKISKIYQLANTEFKLALDELFPSYKIGKFVIYLTRKDNPRVIVVNPKRNSALIQYIVALIHAKNLTSKERAFVSEDLEMHGISKYIDCEAIAFIALLLGVDVKTLRKDINNAI